MRHMEPTPELVRSLYQDKIDAARGMSFAEKFMAGPELFDYACTISMVGIRMQHPDFDEAQVRGELRRRLEIGRRIEGRV